ncbi:unnamed protein product [Rhizopus stolonifer]
MRWVMEYVGWMEEQWRIVVWSDESRYTVRGNDGGARVIRKTEESILAYKFGCGGFGPLIIAEEAATQDYALEKLIEKRIPEIKDTEDLKRVLNEERMYDRCKAAIIAKVCSTEY